jgi:hypothetical protein
MALLRFGIVVCLLLSSAKFLTQAPELSQATLEELTNIDLITFRF